MTINEIGRGLVRSFGTRDASETDRDGAEEPSGRGRADSVGLSTKGLALAARARQIEARMESGVYDDPALAEEVARRLLDSGDLDLIT